MNSVFVSFQVYPRLPQREWGVGNGMEKRPSVSALNHPELSMQAEIPRFCCPDDSFHKTKPHANWKNNPKPWAFCGTIIYIYIMHVRCFACPRSIVQSIGGIQISSTSAYSIESGFFVWSRHFFSDMMNYFSDKFGMRIFCLKDSVGHAKTLGLSYAVR